MARLKVSGVGDKKITSVPSSVFMIPGKEAYIQTAKTPPKVALPPKTKLIVPHSTNVPRATTISTRTGEAANPPSTEYWVNFIAIAC